MNERGILGGFSAETVPAQLPALISAFERHYGMSRSEMSDAARMAGDHLKVALLPLKRTDTHGSPSLRKHATEAIDAFAAARAR